MLGDAVFIGSGQKQNDINSEFGIWTPGTIFEQSFRASHNKLSCIDVWIDSYRPWDSPYLELRLLEIHTDRAPDETSYAEIQQNAKEVRTKRINGWLLSPHMFNSFSFKAIPDSSGKQYLFSIQSPELHYGGTSILRGSYRKRLEGESFFVNGRLQEKHDLAFRVFYQDSRAALLQKAFQSLSLQKPFPFSEPVIYYVLLLVYLFLLALLLWRLGRLLSV